MIFTENNVEFYPTSCQFSDEENILLINKIVGKLDNDGMDVNSATIFIYFCLESSISNGKLGSLYIKGSPAYLDYCSTKKKGIHPQNNRYKEFQYLILLYEDVRCSTSECYKANTITHEFRHLYQYEADQLSYLKNIVIKCFLNRQNILFITYKIPIEYDAYLFTKLFLIKHWDIKTVNEHIQNERNNSSVSYDKDYWEFNDSIDTAQDYDWISETNKLWEKYKADIERLYKEKIGANADPFLESYEYLYSFGAE